MFSTEAEARAFTLGDLPLVQRLKSRGISMDSRTYLSRGLHTVGDATLSRLPLADLGTPTVIVRFGHEQAFGQIRHKTGDPDAHIMFIAPTLAESFTYAQESAWLLLLDTLSRTAGQRGAQNIHAEVDENSVVYEALRKAGFAAYARQDIWLRSPDTVPPGKSSQLLRKATPQDQAAIRYLHAQIVPRLAQKADPMPPVGGLVHMADGRAQGYIAVSEGSRGLYLKPYLHMDNAAMAHAVMASALTMLERTNRLPVYCCIRQYQSWLGEVLEAWGFTPWARQTVMVKHTTARIEHPAFSPLPNVQGGITIQGGPTGKC